jgi:formylglycine-generating enzyme required for sulfatase activity
MDNSTVRNSLEMEFKLILPGTFLMGSTIRDQTNFGRLDEGQRRLSISRPFYLGAYEVTRGQYRQYQDALQRGEASPANVALPPGGATTAIDGINRFDANANWDAPPFPQNDEHPVIYVSWHEAVAFCSWLSMKEGRTYRLPTEAEWEYAARGGSSTTYWWGDDPEGALGKANIADRAYAARFPVRDYGLKYNDGFIFTAPVGSFQANPFGLHDMIGNVFEWVQDWYALPSTSPDHDPKGPDNGQLKVAKGGGWASAPAESRLSFRFREDPSLRFSGMGFRVLLQVD